MFMRVTSPTTTESKIHLSLEEKLFLENRIQEQSLAFHASYKENDFASCKKIFKALSSYLTEYHALYSKLSDESVRQFHLLQHTWTALRKADSHTFSSKMRTSAKKIEASLIQMFEHIHSVSAKLEPTATPTHNPLDLKQEHSAFQSWVRAGLEADLFFQNPEEAKFLIRTHLHHQIRYYNHSIQTKEGHLHILVSGGYRPVSEIKEQFNYSYTTFSLKENPEEKWQYLPLTGLSKSDPIEWAKLEPIYQLSEDEVKMVQQRAQKLPSPLAIQLNKQTDYTLQVVSSWAHTGKKSWFMEGIRDQFLSPRHPWIRLITPDGKVYSVGFNWSKPVNSNIGQTVQGKFRSPDTWESMPHLARFITHIAISKDQFEEILHHVEKYQQIKVPFNLVRQNCSAFISHTLASLGFDVNFQASLVEVIRRVCPIGIKTILNRVIRPCRTITRHSIRVIRLFLPPITTYIIKIFQRAIEHLRAFGRNTLLLILGGSKGITVDPEGPEFFSHTARKNDKIQKQALGELQKNTSNLAPKKKRIVRLYRNILDMFDRHRADGFMPRLVIEWQTKQPSNIIVAGTTSFPDQFRPTASALIIPAT